MTWRAVLIGLVGAALLARFTYFNDQVVRSTMLIANYLPMSVFGLLVLFLVGLNPLLSRYAPRWHLTAKELATATAIMLFACCVPGRSLMHVFTNQLMMPHHYDKSSVWWGDAMDKVPPRMLADPSRNPDEALTGFVSGLKQGNQDISLVRDVPWYAWTRTLGFWIPLLVTFFVATIGLAMVVHRQWQSHEHLSYPTVQFARALLPAEGESAGAVFRDRLFLTGAGIVMAIHAINYAHAWWPRYLVSLNMRLDMYSLRDLVPVLRPYHFLFRPRLYFTAMAFAFFVASEISFSVGIAPYLLYLAAGVSSNYGVNLSARHARSGVGHYLYGGAFMGMFCMLGYYGRRYYAAVARKVFARGGGDEVEPSAVWGGRLALGGGLLCVIQLSIVGLDWQLALLFTMIAMAYYTVVSRLVAEGGVFFVQAYLMPGGLILGFLGWAIGRDQLLIMGLLGMVMTHETRALMMPFAVSGLALTDRSGGKTLPVAAWGIAAMVLALAIAVPTTLYWQYRYGSATTSDYYVGNARPKMAFQTDAHIRQKLQAQGLLDEAERLSGWARLWHARPNGEAVTGFVIAFGLVVLLSYLRQRFRWWPLHPLLLVILGSWPGICLGPSFLLGWLLKTAVLRYGGAPLYEKAKRVMVGVIAGEMLAGLLILVHAFLYYWITGQSPRTIHVMPG